jgi:hypothetical protein
MLYLAPPYYFINGVMVYRDHADEQQYYFMPMAPRLRRIKDPQTGKMVPRISLLLFRSQQVESGGFADFDVHVGLEPDELDELRQELRRLARLAFDPRLAPVPVVGGSVRMLLFGEDSAAPPPDPTAGPAPPKQFVLKMNHAAKPSLYGDNAAAFSVRLDAQGATLLENALRGEMAPIAIVYQLDYVALRPAFSVRLSIDWDRVQEFMDETHGHEGMFTSVEIGNTVDKLIDKRAIVLEADSFVADAEDQGSTADRMEAAKARVQDMITDAFFQPSIEPLKKEPDGWDKAKDVLRTIQRGPLSIFGTYSYKKQNYKRIDRKRLDVSVSERSAVMRTIYPQGHIDGLFRVLRDGDPVDRYIRRIEADDPWFQRRRVKVINRVDKSDGVASVHVKLRYGDQVKDVVFDTTGAEQVFEWLNIVESGAVRRRVDAEVAINFTGVDVSERPAVVRSGVIAVEGDVFEVRASDYYASAVVPVGAARSYPWARFPRIEVELRYRDPAHGIAQEDRVVLEQDSPSREWRIFRLDPTLQNFEYRIIHRAANNADVEGPWTSTDAEFVDVRDPFPAGNRLRVDVVPVVARWDDVENVFVDLFYEDPANDVRETAMMTFNAANRAPQPFVVDLRDSTRRGYSYEVTTVLKDGSVLGVPRSWSESARLLVRPDMRGRRVVAVRPPGDFRAAGLERLTVDLRFADDAIGTLEDRFEFRTGGGRQTFEYEYLDPQRDRYEYRADFLFSNGTTRRQEWTATDANELDIRVP